MSAQRDPDAILATWLEEGPMRLPDATRRAIAVSTATTHQARRPIWSSWRYPFMNTYAKLAITALVVVVVGAAGLALLGPGLSGIGSPLSPGPSHTASQPPSNPPSEAPAASPSSALTDTANWVSFTSTRYGYTISHPPSWSATPADKNSTATTPPVTLPDSSSDQFVGQSTSQSVMVSSFAINLPGGMAFDDWVNRYYTPAVGKAAPCSNPPTMDSITVDGHPGDLAVNDPCSSTEAFVLVDGRIHEFGVWRANERPLFDAFLSTVTFAPASQSASPNTLAKDGFVYPGRYRPAFDPRMAFSISSEVEHNCAFGFTCRGSIDVNLAGWLGLEFGQPATDVNIVRVDKVDDPSRPGKVMDPPADLVGWIASRPGLGQIAQRVATVGGVEGTQVDLQVGNKDVAIGPIPGVADPRLAFPANSVVRVAVMTIDGHRILIVTHASDGSLEELQPLVDSIVWG